MARSSDQNSGPSLFYYYIQPLIRSEVRDLNAVATTHGGFMGTDADHGPVGRGFRIWECSLIPQNSLNEGMHEVRMASAVATALKEAEVICILNGGWHGELLDRFRKQAGEVWNGGFLSDLWLRNWLLCRTLGVDQRLLILSQLPLKRGFGTISIETFAILTSGIEQAPSDFSHHIRPLDLERG